MNANHPHTVDDDGRADVSSQDQVIEEDVTSRRRTSSILPQPSAIEVANTAQVEREESIQQAGGLERRESVVRDAAGEEHREVRSNDLATSQWWWLSKLSSAVWLVVAIVEVLIGMRVLLRAVAANPANPFANFIYGVTGGLLAPFFGMTGSPAVGGAVLEIPSIVAMIVYFLIGWLVVAAIWLAERPFTHSATRYDRYRV
jgi:YGGT family